MLCWGLLVSFRCEFVYCLVAPRACGLVAVGLVRGPSYSQLAMGSRLVRIGQDLREVVEDSLRLKKHGFPTLRLALLLDQGVGPVQGESSSQAMALAIAI